MKTRALRYLLALLPMILMASASQAASKDDLVEGIPNEYMLIGILFVGVTLMFIALVAIIYAFLKMLPHLFKDRPNA